MAGNDSLSIHDEDFNITLQDDRNFDGNIDSVSTTEAFFQANLGSIEVDGGDIEFGRTDTGNPTSPFPNVSPAAREAMFFNARRVNAVGGNVIGSPVVGTITGNNSTMVFHTGLYNTGVLAFTGGDNIVSGRVENGSFDYDPGGGHDEPTNL